MLINYMVNNRLALLLSFGLFGLLIALALVFYLERMTNLDMAFQTFLMLKSGNVEIQSGRFGAIATQIWPWAAQVMGLSLKGVLLAYSLGHALWSAILAAFCWRIGQWRWSLAIGLVATLMAMADMAGSHGYGVLLPPTDAVCTRISLRVFHAGPLQAPRLDLVALECPGYFWRAGHPEI